MGRWLNLTFTAEYLIHWLGLFSPQYRPPLSLQFLAGERFSDHWAYPTPDRSHPALKIFHFYCKYFTFIENIFDGSAVNSIGYISITEWSRDSSTPYGKSYFTNSYSILLQTQTEVVYKRSIFTSFIHKINLVIKILSYNCSYLKQRQ